MNSADAIEALKYVVAFSAGSACHSGPWFSLVLPPHAMIRSARSSVRFTVICVNDIALLFVCAGEVSVSSVLKAVAVPPEFARGTLRLSVGRHTTESDVDAAAGLIAETLQRLMQRVHPFKE